MPIPRQMRHRHRLLALAAVGLLACTATGLADTESKVQSSIVPAGEQRELAFFASLNPDCSAIGEMTLRLARPAEHGSVEIERGLGYTKYGRKDQRYACNRAPVEGYRVNYISQPDYLGEDSFEIQLFSPAGNYVLWKYDITVK